MRALGYERAFVDAAGNAVGELGAPHAARTVVLLGHIDTVHGDIPVRVEETPGGPVLFGRGSVDAKGPLAAFVAAGARVGSEWARAHDLRFVVVGAVEEEAASSKGARFIRDRFGAGGADVPAACIVGEPSGWQRVTLGYKGRVLVELDAAQPMAHTAGPDAGVATVAVEFWNWLAAYAARANAGRDKAFDQVQPSLRRLRTFTDAAMRDHAQAQAGIRLPLGFDLAAFTGELLAWAGQRAAVAPPAACAPPAPEQPATCTLAGEALTLTLHLHAAERAWRSDRNSPLARCFLGALRACAPDVRPAFLVKTGTSDMNVVAPAWHCPIVAYGPGDSALDHTPHEHLPLADYLRALAVLEGVLRTIGGFLE
jgi:LysW-gamma-L-lysine carboxypeptidase